jgi:pimeloyl-ACP methyl ester carboxylesterase
VVAVRNWLLLRGLVREARHWAGFAEQLAAATGGEVRTLDLPGVGTERDRPSPWSIDGIVDDLRARFPERGWGVFAPSLGGMIAMRWAERRPGDFSRVVVCNTSARDLAWPWERFSPLAIRTALRGVMTSDPAARESGTLRLVANTEAAWAMVPRFAAFAADAPVGRGVLLRQLWAASRSRAPHRLEVPVLVLASEGDRLCSPLASRRLADRLGAPLFLHPSAGHDLPLDDPAWVIERLCQGFAAN